MNEYRERVYRLARQIPAGKVMPYGQIAIILDELLPDGPVYTPQTVGWAMHALGDTDCWLRVINSKGGCSTGKVMLPGNKQQLMLTQEGIEFDETARCDLARFLWIPDETARRRSLINDFFRGSKGAIFSACGTFRYALWRIWSPSLPLLMVIGLNPSRAGAVDNDNTVVRCIGYGVLWGFGGLLMGNPFAFCDTHQFSLRSAPDRIGPDNDLWLARMRDHAGMHLAAWGNNAEIDPKRIAAVRAMFPKLYTLGFTQSGQPKHPLRLAKTLKPILWEEAAEAAA